MVIVSILDGGLFVAKYPWAVAQLAVAAALAFEQVGALTARRRAGTKNFVHVDLLTPSLSTEERLRHRHIEPGLSLRAGSSMSNKRYLYSASSCPMWRSKHSYMPP